VFIVDPETLIKVARLDIPKPLIIVINKRGFSKLAKKEIYGIARPEFGIAVIFIKSILECSRSVSQFLLRFAKLIMHELGHLFFLSHCDNIACVMHHHSSIENIDLSGHEFCDKCKVIFSTSSKYSWY